MHGRIVSVMSMTLLLSTVGCHRQSQGDVITRNMEDSLKVKKLELVDEQGKVRLVLDSVMLGGISRPEIRMLDVKGGDALLIQLDSKDEGRIIYNGNGVDAALTVGSVPTGDAGDQNKTFWGIRIINPRDTARPVKVFPSSQ